MSVDDQEEKLRVIREVKRACHVYITKNGDVEVPDHKTRLAAVALDLAYREGKPLERQVTARAEMDNFPELLAKCRQSQLFNELEAQESSQKAVEGKEIPPALPLLPQNYGLNEVLMNEIQSVGNILWKNVGVDHRDQPNDGCQRH